MRFLVIGLGSIGTRHAENLIAMGHEVVGHDINLEALGTIPLISKTEDIDACIICSPTFNHSDRIRYAAERGWHIFVEKPIALAQDNFLERGLAIAREKNLVVMVGNNLRFHSCVKKAKEWMDAKTIGHPIWAQFVVAQLSKKETYLQDGVISNWGAHELDLARYLLGECMVLSCVGDEEMADIILQHTNGCQTIVHLDYLTEPEQRRFSITGHKGSLSANLTRRFAMLPSENSDIEYFRDSFDDNYKEEMNCFIRMINSEGLHEWEHPALGSDGLAVLKLIERAQEMARLS